MIKRVVKSVRAKTREIMEVRKVCTKGRDVMMVEASQSDLHAVALDAVGASSEYAIPNSSFCISQNKQGQEVLAA